LTLAALIALAATGGKVHLPPPAADANTAALTVVVFGDSLTGHRPQESYQGKYLKYSDLLELMLEVRLGLGKVEVINAGWAGDATYAKTGQGMPGAVGRLEKDVIDHDPDIVFALIGGNDQLASDAERTRTRKNLDAIAGRIRTSGAKLLMGLYPPSLPDPNNATRAWDLTGANPLITAAAGKANAKLLDLGPAMVRAAKTHGRDAVASPVDGVHLKPRGEMVFARAIYHRLEGLGWLKSKRTDRENNKPHEGKGHDE
jgi:lysophospholipase L1-like esterase